MKTIPACCKLFALFAFIAFSFNATVAQNIVKTASSGFTEGYITKWSPYSGGYDRISNSAIFQNSSGNIGVGTDNPLFKLSVNGNTNITGNFTNTGTIKTSSFHGFDNGLVLYDTSGKFIPYSFSGNSSQVLLGNGTWGNVPITNDTNKWQFQNGNLFTLTSGNVGVGLNNPQFKLDILGDVRISENLYVGGGIIISNEVNATDAVTTLRLIATTMQTSTIAAETIEVDNLKTTGNFTFAGDKVLSYVPKPNSSFGNYSLGKTAPQALFEVDECLHPSSSYGNNLTFCGTVKAWAHRGWNDSNPINVLSMGFDGSNGTIDITGNGNPGLLINYYCGKDVFINTGEHGGNIQLAGIGNVGIGVSPSTEETGPKLDIDGNVKIRTLEAPETTFDMLVADDNNIICKKSLNDIRIGDDLGSHTATQNIKLGAFWLSGSGSDDGIFINSENRVGIGTLSPTAKLEIKVNSAETKAISIYNDGIENFLVKGNGNVWAREVTVILGSALGDFVFDKDYKLMPINEFEAYVNNNRHLPGIPSASEVNKSGLNVGEFQNLLLQKVEELSLYIIQLEKRIKEVEK